MPICKICGKTLKNPNSASHINSKFHQSKIGSSLIAKSMEISTQNAIETRDFNELKNIVLNLEKRMRIIEKQIQSIQGDYGVKLMAFIISRNYTHILDNRANHLDLINKLAKYYNEGRKVEHSAVMLSKQAYNNIGYNTVIIQQKNYNKVVSLRKYKQTNNSKIHDIDFSYV